MTFKEAEQLVFEQLPAFSKSGRTAIKPGLYHINELCSFLDNPQNKFKSIHVAGTNGKGSTCHILAAAFSTAGYKTGLYTSPHLSDIRERCRIDGQLISQEFFIDFVQKIQPLLVTFEPSYFELNVALAFYAFARENVDIAIIETGLGGRLDSTNIIQPELSIITHIALDHTEILGNSLEEIAKEKAGIIKVNTPVVIGKTQEETEKVFVQTALGKQSPIIFADQMYTLVAQPECHSKEYNQYQCVAHASGQTFPIQTDLKGAYQSQNIATALAALDVMNAKGWNVSAEAALTSLCKVRERSGLKGRWDFFSENIILDVAHNPDGIAEIVQSLKNLHGNLRIVFGAARDKDTSAAASMLPTSANYYLTQAQVPRAKPVEELAKDFKPDAMSVRSFQTVEAAVAQALIDLQPEEYLIILGSFFVVGEAYQYLENMKS